VYAEDLAQLPDWQQQAWAGYNIGPEGGVSAELLAAQAEGEPAKTEAPEKILPRGLIELNSTFRSVFGVPLLRPHENTEALLKTAHRFRALNQETLFALAKDLARLTAESIEVVPLHHLVAPPKGEKWGSLKSLEKALATRIPKAEAHSIMGPLFGVNDLRQADAHLPSNDLQSSFDLAGIDRNAPFVTQGMQMLDTCASTLVKIARNFTHPVAP